MTENLGVLPIKYWHKVGGTNGQLTQLPVTSAGFHKPIISPAHGSAVYIPCDNRSKLQLVVITAGDFAIDGRISNFWHWKTVNQDLTVSEEEQSGYGNFYVPVKPIQVHTHYSIKI